MDEASRTQITAADPTASTWLAANAGAGKTRVLTDRVARLLLSGVPPQSILCLTFTKAAATEMQNRLFKTLGAWAMMSPDALRQALGDLGEAGPFDQERLARAQRLFARAIETPGGLKIQTIHAFCAALLRRFPLEAGVSPLFQEVEETALLPLCRETADEIATGPNRAVFDAFAAQTREDAFEDVILGLLKHRAKFDPPLDRAEIFDLFGISPDLDQDSLVKGVFSGGEEGLLNAAAGCLAKGGKTDVALAAKLQHAAQAVPSCQCPAPSRRRIALWIRRENPLWRENRQAWHKNRPRKDGRWAL